MAASYTGPENGSPSVDLEKAVVCNVLGIEEQHRIDETATKCICRQTALAKGLDQVTETGGINLSMDNWELLPQ